MVTLRFLDLVAGVDEDDDSEDETEEGEAADEAENLDEADFDAYDRSIPNISQQGDADLEEAFDALLERSKQRGKRVPSLINSNPPFHGSRDSPSPKGPAGETDTTFSRIAELSHGARANGASLLHHQAVLPGPIDVPIFSLQVKVR